MVGRMDGRTDDGLTKQTFARRQFWFDDIECFQDTVVTCDIKVDGDETIGTGLLQVSLTFLRETAYNQFPLKHKR